LKPLTPPFEAAHHRAPILLYRSEPRFLTRRESYIRSNAPSLRQSSHKGGKTSFPQA